MLLATLSASAGAANAICWDDAANDKFIACGLAGK